MMEVRPAPRVMFASPVRYLISLKPPDECSDIPNGCPNLASAAPLTIIGIGDLIPKIVVEGSTLDIGLSTRGWKKKREKARAFSAFAVR